MRARFGPFQLDLRAGELRAHETFVEFEQSIGMAMKKLRQALGDDAAERYWQ